MLDAEGRPIIASMEGTEDGRVKGFLCRRAREFEIGRNEGGAENYPSIKALKDHNDCADSGNLIEVRVMFKRCVIRGSDRDYRPSADGSTPWLN